MKNIPGHILMLDQADSLLTHFLTEHGFTVTLDTQSSFASIQSELNKYQGVILRSRWTLDATFFEAAPHLLFIGRLGVGIEHIDEESARKNKVTIFTTPEASKDTVAEHTLGLLLMMLNKLGKADREVSQNIWDRNANRAIELKGKKVGILGFGNMGRAVAQRLSGFEVDILIRDISPTLTVPSYTKQVEDDEFFSETDILTIHIPLNETNKYFINYAYLKKFKKEIFLINTARGGVVETEGLVKQLKEGKVKGAALDVIEYEEQSFNALDISSLPPPFQYLKKAENVILNPHLAGISYESVPRHAYVMTQKISKLFKLDLHVE